LNLIRQRQRAAPPAGASDVTFGTNRGGRRAQEERQRAAMAKIGGIGENKQGLCGWALKNHEKINKIC